MEEETRIFDPQIYVDQYYKTSEGSAEENIKGVDDLWTNQAFDIIPECESCIEIGCGPVIKLGAHSSRKCRSVSLFEYNMKCFDSIIDWVNHPEKKTNWDLLFKDIAKLQGTSAKEVSQRFRSRLSLLGKCDLTQENIIDLPYVRKADVITSSLTVEAVAKDLAEWAGMIGKMKRLLKAGGYLYLYGVLGQTFYKVGHKKLPCLSLTEAGIRESIEKNGFTIVKFNSDLHLNPPSITSDFEGLFSVLAKDSSTA